MPDAGRSSLEAFGALFARSRQPMYVLDARTLRFLDANAAALRFYGKTREQFLKLSLLAVRQSAGSAFAKRYVRAHRFGLPWAGETRHRGAGGKMVDVSIYALPTKTDGRAAWVVMIVPVKKEERAARARSGGSAPPDFLEARSLKLLFQTNPQPMWVFDAQTLRFLAVNGAARRLYGYSDAEWRRMKVSDVRPKEDLKRFLATLRRDVRRGAFHAGTWRHLRKDGSVLQVDVRAMDVTVGGRRARLSVLNDITDRTLADRKRAQAERLLASVVDNAPVILFAIDRRGVFTLSTGRGLAGLGLKPGQFLGRSLFDVYGGHAQIVSDARRALRGEAFTAVAEVQGRLYSTQWTPVAGPSGREGAIGVANDVTDSAKLEQGLRESEARLRKLYTKTPAMLHSIDRDGRILNVSDHWLATLGYAREEVLGRRSTEFLTPESARYAKEKVLPEFYRTGVTKEAGYQMVRKDGRVLDVLLSASAERDADGKVLRSLAIITDVTQRKKDEAALRLSDTVFSSSADGIVATDLRGRFIKVNRAFERMTGYPESGLLGRTFQDITPAEFRKKSKDVLDAMLAGKAAVKFEKEYRRKDGSRFPVHLTVFRVMDEAGAHSGFAAIIKDITEQRRAQDELEEAKAWYEALVNSSRDAIHFVDRSGKLLDVNPAMEELVGYTRQELLSRSFHDITPDEYRAVDEAAFRRLEKGEPAVEFEKEYRRKNGKRVPVALTAFVVKEPSGRPRGYAAFARDVTERKRAEQVRTEMLSLHEATLESTADGILVVDKNGRMTHFNRRFAEMWGIPPAILAARSDRRTLAFVRAQLKDPSSFIGRLKKLYGESSAQAFDTLEFKDGRVFERYSQPQLLNGRVAGRVWSFRDVTERRRLEKQIAETAAREQAKLGRDLHDSIGQTLTAVSLGLKALERTGGPDSAAPIARLDALTRLAIQQVRDVARGLLPHELQAGDLGASLRALSAGARKMFGVNCQVAVRGDTQLRDNATAVQLYRIAQEALNNAAKHARSRDGVRISLDAGDRSLRLIVRDDGVGISPVARRGGSPGLGIAIMRHRAESLGGTLAVRRAPGGGTEVICECPRPGAVR